MLLSFEFENFRSFADRAALSLAAHSAHKEFSGALIETPGDIQGVTHAVPVVAIYGANASGKTNAIKAFDEFKSAVLNSHARWDAFGPTNADPHALREGLPTTFEVQFISSGTHYRYGLSYTSEMIVGEWLYSYPKRRERLLFVRTQADHNGAVVKFGSTVRIDDRDRQSVLRRLRPNSLLVSAGAQDNLEPFSDIYKWFYDKTDTQIVALDVDDVGFTHRLCTIDGVLKRQIFNILKSADSNLRDLIVSREGNDVRVEEEWAKALSSETLQYLIENRDHKAEFVFGMQGKEFFLPLSEQSVGTQKLYGLASLLLSTLADGKILLVDEIESSLHPHVAVQIIGLFQSKATNPNGAQLILTTHDTNLLSSQLLRRDQIWFTEKIDGGSTLFSLLEFNPRKDDNVERAYLRGRYGAIPSEGFGSSFFVRDEASS